MSKIGTRRWLYAVTTAVLALLALGGGLTQEQVALWTGLVGAVGAALATTMTTQLDALTAWVDRVLPQAVRRRIYTVLMALLPLLGVYGLISGEMVAALGVLAGAVFGVVREYTPAVDGADG